MTKAPIIGASWWFMAQEVRGKTKLVSDLPRNILAAELTNPVPSVACANGSLAPLIVHSLSPPPQGAD